MLSEGSPNPEVSSSMRFFSSIQSPKSINLQRSLQKGRHEFALENIAGLPQ